MCLESAQQERKRIVGLIEEQHLLAAAGELRRYGLRMVECMTVTCDCYSIIEMIMENTE